MLKNKRIIKLLAILFLCLALGFILLMIGLFAFSGGQYYNSVADAIKITNMNLFNLPRASNFGANAIESGSFVQLYQTALAGFFIMIFSSVFLLLAFFQLFKTLWKNAN